MIYNLLGIAIVWAFAALTSWPLYVSIPVGIVVACVASIALGAALARFRLWRDGML